MTDPTATPQPDASSSGDNPAPDTAAAEGAQATATAEEAPKKLHQNIEVRDIGPCKKHVKVTIERGDIDGRMNEKFSEMVTETAVPGFRPGKAPRRVIERRFGKDVTEQVKTEVLFASLEQLAEESNIAP